MAVSVKMDVDLSGFNSGIKEGQNILKGLNAEMKATEAEFKATGNAEKALEQKTKTLTSQLNVQKAIADQAAAALKKMEEHGVKPTDAAYQKMYVTMMNARAGMNTAQEGLNNLDGQQQKTKQSAEDLKDSLNGIGKKISLDQVISGISSITKGLETAARKAVDLGKEIWNAAMDAARMSDDILTQANMLDMTPEQYQQYKGVFDTIGEITIAEWAAAKRKVQKAINDPSKDQVEVLEALGLTTKTEKAGKYGAVDDVVKDWETVFWEAANALKTKVEAGEISQDLADTYGEAIFGKKFSSLKTLIDMGRETFNEALENQNTASDEALQKNADLNDAVIKLQNSFDKLKIEVLSGLAPELTKLATSLDTVLGSILDYLNTPEGKEMMDSLGNTIASLFEDIQNIDTDSAIEIIKGAFDSINSALDWIKENSGTIIGAIEGIGIAFAGLKLGEIALNVWKFVDGAKTLMGLGGKGEGGGGGTTNGTTSGKLVGVSNAITGVASNAAALLTTYDPTGLTALIPTWIGDNTAFGRTLANGGSIKEAFEASAAQIADTFSEESVQAFKDNWDPNSENANVLVKFFDQVAKNLKTANDAIEEEKADHGVQKSTPSVGWVYGDDWTMDEIMADLGFTDGVPVEVAPEVPPGAAEALTSQIGTVPVYAQLVLNNPNAGYSGGGGSGLRWIAQTHANGLPFVPYDGYLAMLHRGERVLTARANRSYTYNSNNYFGNVNLNNGHDIDELCTSIDRHNRRMQSGFGA